MRRLAAKVIQGAFWALEDAERFSGHRLPAIHRALRGRAVLSKKQRAELADAVEMRSGLESDLLWFGRVDGFEWWVSVLHYTTQEERGIHDEYVRRATKVLARFRLALDVDHRAVA